MDLSFDDIGFGVVDLRFGVKEGGFYVVDLNLDLYFAILKFGILDIGYVVALSSDLVKHTFCVVEFELCLLDLRFRVVDLEILCCGFQI